MALTLHTDAGNFRAFKALIAAEYCGVSLKVEDVKIGKDNVTAEFQALSPLGKVPVLQTAQGAVFESNAIARYVARLNPSANLYGPTFFESAQVDSWVDFTAHEVELPASLWVYPVLGYTQANEGVAHQAKEALARALGVLDAHLADKTYLVGHAVTLADIVCASALVYPFKFVMDPAFRAPFGNVTRWFTTVVNQPQFAAVVGEVALCETEAAAAAGGKKEAKKEKKEAAPKPAKEAAPKEEKKKEEKKKAKKDEDEEEDDMAAYKEVKAPHPLAQLDQSAPSKFGMDSWKRLYSNADNYDECMAKFWELFDAEGYSLWRADYKFNEENTVQFMTSNLVGGFLQRTGEVRKWAFGTLAITGDAAPFNVTGCWLIRSHTVQHILDCNPDAEYYNWTRMDHTSEADRATVKAMWIADTNDKIEGRTVLENKVFK